jgi:DNA-binding NarL/FixJ family response regulator
VVLSQFADPGYGLALFEAGSDRRASLLKERIQRGGQLVSAIQAVAAGGSFVDELVLTERAAEKHINAIFLKLNLPQAEDVSRRVKAALIYLAARGDG